MLKSLPLFTLGICLVAGNYSNIAAASPQDQIPDESRPKAVRREIPAVPAPLVPQSRSNPIPENEGRTAQKIRIGRLELTRKPDSNFESDQAYRSPLDDMSRSALHLDPRPAITFSFDLHWIEPKPKR